MKGRHGCQKAWIVRLHLYKFTKFEHISDRITVAKIEVPHDNYKGLAIIGSYMASNNNANNEFEGDLELIEATHRRLKKLLYREVIIGDFNSDSGRNLYTQDKIMAKWLDDENKIELTRLFLQPIPFTYLSPIGSFSCIDHFIVDTHDNNNIVKNVNIISTSKEFKNLRDSNDGTLNY
jgi:hypothetical protein